MRLLHIPPDPRAPDPTESEAWKMYASGWLAVPRQQALLEFVEPLVVRDLVPHDWLENARIDRLARLQRAVLPILRNPRALIDAEALLREGLAGTCGRYVGLRSWDALCGTAYAADHGHYLPSAGELGFDDAAWVDLSRDWIEATRDTGSSYGNRGMENVWCCAHQILGGPPWVEALYRTGLGLWCSRDNAGAPEWVLIVRPGDGLPWPRTMTEQLRAEERRAERMRSLALGSFDKLLSPAISFELVSSDGTRTVSYSWLDDPELDGETRKAPVSAGAEVTT